MAAENSISPSPASRAARRFNEAAANGRGKPWQPGDIVTAAQLLQ